MQAEIFDDGDFEYRYDLSRISDMDALALTNVVIGAKFGTNELGDVSWLLDGTNTVTSIRLHRLSECDWNGGTGTRYYEMELKSVLIRTFLMYGNQSETKMDIPLESVDGLIRDDSAPSGGRPSWAAIGFRGHQMHGITQ